jgi:hypothetical protein
MEITAQPDAMVHEAGMPQDRATRIAARRAFVDMKLLFMRAVADLEDRKGSWLRAQVRQANDPNDLWLLRVPVLAALRKNQVGTRKLRAELYRSLDSVFPDSFTSAGQSTLPALPEPWAIWASAEPRQNV